MRHILKGAQLLWTGNKTKGVCVNAVRTSENMEQVAATCHEMNEWGWSEWGWWVPRVDLTERAGGELTF